MHVSDLHDYGGKDDHSAAIRPFLNQGQRKTLKETIEEIVSEEFDRLEEFANGYIGDVAAQRAEKFLERVLAGDEKAAMALLGAGMGSGRHRFSGMDADKPWASLIHGRLFERTS